jgi:pilus assembly protein Flp/PilA
LTTINAIKDFFCDEKGATAVEYAIMVSAIAAVIVTIVFVVGTKVDNKFEALESSMTSEGM